MSDKKKKIDLRGKERIDINNPQEVRDWCKALKCEEGELSAVVGIVGKSVKRVKQYLEKIV